MTETPGAGPAKVIGLGKARKARDRAQEKAQADANAVKFGRTKAQRVLDAAQSDRARKMLDAHKRDEE